MSFRNRFYSNTEASKSDVEAKIEIKLDAFKADHMKTVDSLETKYQLSHKKTFLLFLTTIHLCHQIITP